MFCLVSSTSWDDGKRSKLSLLTMVGVDVKVAFGRRDFGSVLYWSPIGTPRMKTQGRREAS